MRKLITAALVLAAMLGAPTVASAHGRDGWNDRDRYEWSDRRGWRDDRDRRHWRKDRHHRGWRDNRRWRGRDVVCRTEWHYGDRRRVCYRR